MMNNKAEEIKLQTVVSMIDAVLGDDYKLVKGFHGDGEVFEDLVEILIRTAAEFVGYDKNKAERLADILQIGLQLNGYLVAKVIRFDEDMPF